MFTDSGHSTKTTKNQCTCTAGTAGRGGGAEPGRRRRRPRPPPPGPRPPPRSAPAPEDKNIRLLTTTRKSAAVTCWTALARERDVRFSGSCGAGSDVRPICTGGEGDGGGGKASRPGRHGRSSGCRLAPRAARAAAAERHAPRHAARDSSFEETSAAMPDRNAAQKRCRGAHASGARRSGARRSCPVSTGGGTRRVQLVRGEGRGVSS